MDKKTMRWERRAEKGTYYVASKVFEEERKRSGSGKQKNWSLVKC